MLDERYSRQTFLGPNSQKAIEDCRIGVIGCGGGGSHFIQQLAHLGFKNFEIFDPDVVEISNLNRTVGATLEDAIKARPKIEVAKRLILGLHPDAQIGAYRQRWQERPDSLMSCHIVVGCVDGLSERQQLEASLRRFLVPLIDIGLGVVSVDNEPPYMAGQIILSAPGGPCMTCMGFLNEKDLAREAQRYGDAGPRPQVVWANGVLASTAVGIAVEMLTQWTQRKRPPIYMDYRANESSVTVHARERFAPTEPCPHFPLSEVGPVKLKPL